MLLNLQHLSKVEVYFNWNLIVSDTDDNKYVDAAIAGGADYIVTNDNHFNILNSIEFPSVKVLSIEAFLAIVKK